MGDWYNQEHRTLARFNKGSITPILHLTINRQALKAVKENKADKDRTQGGLTSNASPRLTNKTKCVEGQNKVFDIYLRCVRL